MMIATGPVSSALAMPEAAALRLELPPSAIEPLPGSPPNSTTATNTRATTASTTTAANPI